jgi:hypothetical protein
MQTYEQGYVETRHAVFKSKDVILFDANTTTHLHNLTEATCP